MTDQSVPEIDVAELADKPDVPLIDVREPHEYEEARVPWAKLIPLGEVTDRVDEIPSDEPVYIICAVGGRSARAAEWLITQGVDATNVAGGTRAWVESGRSVDSGPQAQ